MTSTGLLSLNLFSSAPTGIKNEMDFVATGHFMLYQKKWIPRRFTFVSIYSLKEYHIQPSLESLTNFTFQDVIKNQQLPHNPWQIFDVNENTIEIPLNNFNSYLVKDFYHKELTYPSGWYVHIGTLDMSMYNYLLSLFPLGTVHYLGSIPLKNTILGPQSDIVVLANEAAKNIKMEREEIEKDWK